MFERYTEPARRSLFFARYEASVLGSRTIETEHLLLGLAREGRGITAVIFAKRGLSFAALHEKLAPGTAPDVKISTSVEMPFSTESKQVLQHAAEEANRMLHPHIGTEHLLLGLLRAQHSVAATALAEYGLRADGVREEIVRLLNEKPAAPNEAQQKIQHLQQHMRALVEELGEAVEGNAKASFLAEQVLSDLDALKPLLEP